LGVDVSHWQKRMDWQKAKDAGAEYAFIRAGSINNITGVCYTCFQRSRRMI
jgi:GH25 family lysozyme M1 (1,4-beta-N-acetylmuramidase)